MEVGSKKKELFFNNLLLLGFDKNLIETKHSAKCDKNMFCVPNQKMFEIVSHFLFSKLNELGTQKYPLTWPLFDKVQRRDFQKSCYTYLCSIAQESDIIFPRVVPSILSSYFGDRLYDLYFAFSTHVVQSMLKRNNNGHFIQRPTSNSENFDNIVEMLQISSVLSMEKFREINSASQELIKIFSKCANDFTSHIQKLRSHIALKQSKCQEQKKELSLLCSQDAGIQPKQDDLSSKISSFIEFHKETISSNWDHLQKFFVRETHLWNLLSSEVDEQQEKHLLNALKLTAKESNMSEDFLIRLEQVDSPLDKDTGQLCLIRFLNVFIIYLEFYLSSLKKGEISNLHTVCSVENTNNIEITLKNLRVLNDKLCTEVIPKIFGDAEKFKKALFIDEDQKNNVVDLSNFLNPVFLQQRSWTNSISNISNSEFILNYISHDQLSKDTTTVKVDTHTALYDLDYIHDSMTPELTEKCSSINFLPTDISKSIVSEFKEKMNDSLSLTQISPLSMKPSELNESPCSIKAVQQSFNISDADSETPDNYKFRPSWQLDETLNSLNSLSDCSLLEL